MLPKHRQGIFHQRQGARLVAGLLQHRGGHFAHVQPGQPRRAFDGLAQPRPGNERQEIALAEAVVRALQSGQQLVAVEEVGPYRGDEQQRAFRVLQGMGEQPVKSPPRCRFRQGEQFLELVDDEQEGGVILPAIPQAARQRALILLQPPLPR